MSEIYAQTFRKSHHHPLLAYDVLVEVVSFLANKCLFGRLSLMCRTFSRATHRVMLARPRKIVEKLELYVYLRSSLQKLPITTPPPHISGINHVIVQLIAPSSTDFIKRINEFLKVNAHLLTDYVFYINVDVLDPYIELFRSLKRVRLLKLDSFVYAPGLFQKLCDTDAITLHRVPSSADGGCYALSQSLIDDLVQWLHEEKSALGSDNISERTLNIYWCCNEGNNLRALFDRIIEFFKVDTLPHSFIVRILIFVPISEAFDLSTVQKFQMENVETGEFLRASEARWAENNDWTKDFRQFIIRRFSFGPQKQVMGWTENFAPKRMVVITERFYEVSDHHFNTEYEEEGF